MDSSNSGTPSSKGQIEVKERRKAERKNRNSSEREHRRGRRRGGQPGHPSTGLSVIPVGMSRRPRVRRSSAHGAGPPWMALRWRARRGRRPGTCG